jgi:hypothetical protein
VNNWRNFLNGPALALGASATLFARLTAGLALAALFARGRRVGRRGAAELATGSLIAALALIGTGWSLAAGTPAAATSGVSVCARTMNRLGALPTK